MTTKPIILRTLCGCERTVFIDVDYRYQLDLPCAMPSSFYSTFTDPEDFAVVQRRSFRPTGDYADRGGDARYRFVEIWLEVDETGPLRRQLRDAQRKITNAQSALSGEAGKAPRSPVHGMGASGPN